MLAYRLFEGERSSEQIQRSTCSEKLVLVDYRFLIASQATSQLRCTTKCYSKSENLLNKLGNQPHLVGNDGFYFFEFGPQTFDSRHSATR